MKLEIIGAIGIIIMLVLMFLKMPLGITMAMVGFIGFSYISGLNQGLSVLSVTAFRTGSSFMMSVIPLFVLMGIIAGYGGLSDEAFYTANKWLGHFPGGLAMAAVGGCAAFGSVCGAAVATATTMCTVALPEMRRYKYSDQLSLGTICCGGMLGFMIPPSIPFMLYGIVTNVSIGRLFIAGILPGLLITVLFIFAIYIVCRLNPSLGPSATRASWKERISSLSRVWGILVLFFLVIGGMYGGIFTPTEGGAVGAFGALVLALIKRRINWKNFKASIYDTANLTGMIFILIIGATIFAYFIAVTEIPFSLANFISELHVPPLVVVIVILVIYVIVGFFMEILAVMMLTVPIFFPILQSLSIDPVWFGVLVIVTVMIGQVTPPVGIVVFAVGGLVKDVPLFLIFRGIWPFMYAMLISLIILMALPQISLWLPDLMLPGS